MRALRNAFPVLLSVIAALAICEWAVRWIGYDRLPRTDLYVLDPELGKRMRPGWTGDEFGAPVKINSLGLRNPETTYAKPPNRFRILALGDSWTFGFRIAEIDTYPRQLEHMLNQRALSRGAASRFEVINAGVIGYSTDQEAAYLRVEGYRFRPDLVIVAYYPLNDTAHKLAAYGRYNRLHSIHPWLLEAYLLARNLRLPLFFRGVRNALTERWEERRARPLDPALPADLAAAPPSVARWVESYREGDAGWDAAQEALWDIGARTRGMGARGLVVLLPDLGDLGQYIDANHPRIEPLVRRAVEEAKLDYFDLLETFRPFRERQGELRHAGLRHPNVKGYGMIARAVADEIERRYLGVGLQSQF